MILIPEKRFLLFMSLLPDEPDEVRLQRGQGLGVEIRHLPGLVMAYDDVPGADVRREADMGQGEFRCVEGGSEVKIIDPDEEAKLRMNSVKAAKSFSTPPKYGPKPGLSGRL